jgi:uncharacterized protein YjiK
MPAQAFRYYLAAIWASVWLLLSASPAQAPELPETVHLTQWKFLTDFPVENVPEPSGLCFVALSGTFFAVDDGAADRQAGVYEIDQQGSVLQGLKLGKDLEGVCYCPRDDRLYVADEADERVWIVEPHPLRVVSSVVIARDFGGQEVLTPGGNGFEGIEYIDSTPAGNGDYFLLLNQDDPQALLRVERSALDPSADQPVATTTFHLLPRMNCGELWYDEPHGELWVVHSWQNIYEVLDIDSLAQIDWEVCPGVAQEGLCKDHQGRLWIGSDTGGLAVYTQQ